MNKKVLFSTLLLLIPFFIDAQVNILWQTRYTSSGSNSDKAEDIAIDTSGNVYVTGIGRGASGTFDYVTIKYNSSGTQLWKAEYNGPGNGLDQAHAITIDNNFVYVTGWSKGTGGRGFDFATLKYDINTGAAVWSSAARYTADTLNNRTDEAVAISVDNAGNVYVVGTSESASGTKPNTAAVIVKYNSSGVQQWLVRYEGAGGGLDAANALAVNPVNGDVFVTGYADVAPYPNYNVNYVTFKYNTSGVQQWATFYDSPALKYDEARSISIGPLGNIYVTGYSQNAVVTDYDIATVKYNATGVQQWVQRYNGTGNGYDRGNAIITDAQGNVYVTGRSVGISPAAEDIITIRYSSAGIQKWVARFNNGGVNPYDEGKDLAVDTKGNVYVTGYSFKGNNNNDYTTLKYDSLGVQKWVTHYNGNTGAGNKSDQAFAIAVDSKENVYITGSSYGAGTSEDFETIKYCQLTTYSNNDTAICIGASVQLNASALNAVSYSWSPSTGLSATNIPNPIATPTVTTSYIVSATNSSGCVDDDTVVIVVSSFPTTSITPNGPTSFCVGDSVSLTADSTNSYIWAPLNDTTQTVTIHAAGTYTVTLTNAIGCSSTGTITVVVNSANIVASNNDTTCSNVSVNLSASGGVSYVWHHGITLSDSTIVNPVASPTTTTTYTVVGTDANGCKNSDTVKITVWPAPAIPNIAQGGSYTLACVGSYFSYQWNLGGTPINGATNQIYTYTQNGIYSVTVTDTNGCSVVSDTLGVTNFGIGIDEIGNVALLNVYPNPALSYVTVNLDLLKTSDVQITIMSITGQLIYKENISQLNGSYKKDLSLIEQPAGIYYLQVIVENQLITKKIIKQ